MPRCLHKRALYNTGQIQNLGDPSRETQRAHRKALQSRRCRPVFYRCLKHSISLGKIAIPYEALNHSQWGLDCHPSEAQWSSQKKREALAPGEEEGTRRALEGLLLQSQCQNEHHCCRRTPGRSPFCLARTELRYPAPHHCGKGRYS